MCTEVKSQEQQLWSKSQFKSVLETACEVSVIVILIILLYLGFFVYSCYVKTPVSQEDRIVLTDLLVTREQWHATPPATNGTKLNLPVHIVVISETTTSACYDTADCIRIVKSIQSSHMKIRHWDDIGYNFLIGGDGKIYEGRGWNIQGAHTKGYNQKSIGISFIGIYDMVEPNSKQLKAITLLLDDGIRLQKLNPKFYSYDQKELRDKTFRKNYLNNINETVIHWANSKKEKKN